MLYPSRRQLTSPCSSHDARPSLLSKTAANSMPPSTTVLTSSPLYPFYTAKLYSSSRLPVLHARNRHSASQQHRLQARSPTIPFPLHLRLLATICRDKGWGCHNHRTPTDSFLGPSLPESCWTFSSGGTWRGASIESHVGSSRRGTTIRGWH